MYNSTSHSIEHNETVLELPEPVIERQVAEFNYKYQNFYLNEHFNFVKPSVSCYHDKCMHDYYLKSDQNYNTDTIAKIENAQNVSNVFCTKHVYCNSLNCKQQSIYFIKGPRPKHGGKTKSEIPFIFKDEGFVKFDEKELMIEVLLSCQGMIRKELMEYLCTKTKCLPFVNSEHPVTKMSYSESQIKDMIKLLNITRDNDIEEIISRYEQWEMNFELPEGDLRSSDVSTKPFEYDMSSKSDSSDESEAYIDVKDKIIKGEIHAINSFFANSDIVRTQFLTKVDNHLSVRFLLTDTGSNMTVCSATMYQRMGGRVENLVPASDVQISTTNGTAKVNLLGVGSVELFSVHNGEVVRVGTVQVHVIDTTLNEFIIGTGDLNKINFAVTFNSDQTLVSFNGTHQKQKHSKVRVHQLANECLSLSLLCPEFKQVKSGLTNLQLLFPILPFGYTFQYKSRKLSIAEVTILECQNKPCNKNYLKLSDFYLPVMCQLKLGKDNTRLKYKLDIYPCLEQKQTRNSTFYNNYSDTIYGCTVVNDSMDDLYDQAIPSFDDFKELKEHDLSYLPPEILPKVKRILNDNKDAISSKENPIGEFKPFKFTINTVNDQGPADTPLKLSPQNEAITTDLLEDLVKNKVAKKLPHRSRFNSPVFSVGKRAGKSGVSDSLSNTKKEYTSYRLVQDARSLNAMSNGSGAIVMPTLAEIMAEMDGKIISCLDLKSAFWSLCLDDKSIEKTAMFHAGGQYVMLRAPMGFIESPSWLLSALSYTLSQEAFDKFCKDKNRPGLIGCSIQQFIKMFSDDLTIMSPQHNISLHLLLLEFVLSQFVKVGIKIDISKSAIMKDEFDILGVGFTKHPGCLYKYHLKSQKAMEFSKFAYPKSPRALLGRLSILSAQVKVIPHIKFYLGYFFIKLRSGDLNWTKLDSRVWTIIMMLVGLNYNLYLPSPEHTLVGFFDASLHCGWSMWVNLILTDNGTLDMRVVGYSCKLWGKDVVQRHSTYKEVINIVCGLTDMAPHIRMCKKTVIVITDLKAIVWSLKTKNTNQTFLTAHNLISSFKNVKLMHASGMAIFNTDLHSKLFVNSEVLPSEVKCEKGLRRLQDILPECTTISFFEIEKLVSMVPNETYMNVKRIKAPKTNLWTSEQIFNAPAFEETLIKAAFEDNPESIDLSHPFFRQFKSGPSKQPLTLKEWQNFKLRPEIMTLGRAIKNDLIEQNTVCYQQMQCKDSQVVGISYTGNYLTDTKVENTEANEMCINFYVNHDSLEMVNYVLHDRIRVFCPDETQIIVATNMGDLDYKLIRDNSCFYVYLLKLNNFKGPTISDLYVQIRLIYPNIASFNLNVSCQFFELSNSQVNSHMDIEQFAQYFASVGTSFFLNKIVQIDRIYDSINYFRCLEGFYCKYHFPKLNVYTTDSSENNIVNVDSEDDSEIDTNKLQIQDLKQHKQAIALASLNQYLFLSHLMNSQNQNVVELIKACQMSDGNLKQIISEIKETGTSKRNKKFSLSKKGLLYLTLTKHGLTLEALCLPQWVVVLMCRSFHNTGTHLSAPAMYNLMSIAVTCKGMFKVCQDVTNYCGSCVFQRITPRRNEIGSERTKTTQIPGVMWYTDILSSLPAGSISGSVTPHSQYKHVLVFVCEASSYINCYALRNQTGAEINNYLVHHVSQFPCTRIIRADRQTSFIGWGEILQKFNITLEATISKNSNGKAENQVGQLRRILERTCQSLDLTQRTRWPLLLSKCVANINQTKLTHSRFSRTQLMSSTLSHLPLSCQELSAELVESLAELKNVKLKSLQDIKTKIKRWLPGDICSVTKSKLEKSPILDRGVTSRSLLPTTSSLYVIETCTKKVARIRSLVDGSKLTVPTNRLVKIDTETAMQLSATTDIFAIPFLQDVYLKRQFKAPEFSQSTSDILGNTHRLCLEHLKECTPLCPVKNMMEKYSIPVEIREIISENQNVDHFSDNDSPEQDGGTEQSLDPLPPLPEPQIIEVFSDTPEEVSTDTSIVDLAQVLSDQEASGEISVSQEDQVPRVQPKILVDVALDRDVDKIQSLKKPQKTKKRVTEQVDPVTYGRTGALSDRARRRLNLNFTEKINSKVKILKLLRGEEVKENLLCHSKSGIFMQENDIRLKKKVSFDSQNYLLLISENAQPNQTLNEFVSICTLFKS